MILTAPMAPRQWGFFSPCATVAASVNREILKIPESDIIDHRNGKVCDEVKLDTCLAFNGGQPCYEKKDICKN